MSTGQITYNSTLDNIQSNLQAIFIFFLNVLTVFSGIIQNLVVSVWYYHMPFSVMMKHMCRWTFNIFPNLNILSLILFCLAFKLSLHMEGYRFMFIESFKEPLCALISSWKFLHNVFSWDPYIHTGRFCIALNIPHLKKINCLPWSLPKRQAMILAPTHSYFDWLTEKNWTEKNKAVFTSLQLKKSSRAVEIRSGSNESCKRSFFF